MTQQTDRRRTTGWHINLLRYLFPFRRLGKTTSDEKEVRYEQLWRYTIGLTLLVAIGPLVTLSIINYYQYKKTFREELIRPTQRLTSSVKRSLEFFLEERRAAMQFIIHDRSFDELANQEQLNGIFRNLKESFGGFVDLGLIDSAGASRSYSGPYELRGVNYRNEDWFHEVRLRDVYVSDVFMGHRNFPHFVIAVKHDDNDHGFYVLRATLDVAILQRQIQALELRSGNDAFVINHQGILQTPTRFGGRVLDRSYIPTPTYIEGAEVIEQQDEDGDPYVLGYAFIEQSPFIFLLVSRPEALMHRWTTLRNRLLIFVSVSSAITLLLIVGTASFMVFRLREADERQAKAAHLLEYSNKMATIGRLGAGVAHEINNPLAIINEKAGLLKDFISLDEQHPQRDKFLKLIDSVLFSVERCSRITHRLLGFAKHIDVQREPIDVYSLIKEVLGFMDREASFRNIAVSINVPQNFPTIQSDRGQLQQVFLNIINNAFEALESGGKIIITLQEKEAGRVEVTISDNGPGIPEDVLQNIFEPFFTTKKKHGTGLGLSITYGIIEKLGGQLDVLSEVGSGTSFIVTLPVEKP